MVFFCPFYASLPKPPSPDPIRTLLHNSLLHVSALVLSIRVVSWFFIPAVGQKTSFSARVQLITPS